MGLTGKESAAFSADGSTRSIVHPDKASVMNPAKNSVMTEALSQPRARQFVHGIFFPLITASRVLKIFSPVADTLQMGRAKSATSKPRCLDLQF